MEAEKQHGAAMQNMQAAENNMKVAEVAVRDTRAAASELASQIKKVKAASGKSLLEQLGDDIHVVDLPKTDSIDALKELGLNGGDRYVVLPRSRVETARRAPDTGDAERLVAELQDRWA
ncbi:hypothetical protein ACFVDI_19670 [Nocardioides sp. NPDC057767]|uniref:hypothetical protein n=1 Tax=unclassified Nocardioides TaxID=2615069 RepID=UPI00366D04D9